MIICDLIGGINIMSLYLILSLNNKTGSAEPINHCDYIPLPRPPLFTGGE
jgi:hypothetical protein